MHVFQPTSSYGADCTVYSPSTQFINNCSYSAAYEALNHLHNGTLTAAAPSLAIDRNLLEFDQSEFLANANVGMDEIGYLYIPSKCRNRDVCHLHIAFHGCQQFRGAVGDLFVKNAGYLEVAEVNGIIILFPQVVNSTVNPSGCWDWWGYVDENYCEL